MSAQVNLAGLFVPTSEEQWNENIIWQPVPVHTMPKSLDYVLFFGKRCAKYEAALEKYMKESEEVQRIYSEYAEQFLHWSQESGESIKTLHDVYELHNTLIIEKEHNKT